MRHILVINGNPDANPKRLCAGLADAYATAAIAKGYEVRHIDIGALDFPFIRSQQDFMAPVAHAAIQKAQADVQWAEHIVLVYPLWLGSLPALFKAFLEQVFRYGFGLGQTKHGLPKGLLRGRSAHVFVTMGMPSFFYRWIFGALGERALERSILKLCGIAPVRRTIIGSVGSNAACQRAIEKATFAGMRGN
jgi:putative NADPH-quinone reductase